MFSAPSGWVRDPGICCGESGDQFFPKVTQLRCHHSRQMDPDTRREIDGRLSITQAQTPTGITFQIINIYQFTAANPAGQTEMWTTTENWVNKQKDNRIIMQGDLNCAHSGCRWECAQPLNKDIGTADNKLEHFLKNTSGCSHAQQEHTCTGGVPSGTRSCDHMELPPPTPSRQTNS